MSCGECERQGEPDIYPLVLGWLVGGFWFGEVYKKSRAAILSRPVLKKVNNVFRV